MRHSLILSTALIAACAAGGAAMAQQARSTTTTDGLRYLSWAGKAPVHRPATVPAAPRRVAATATIPRTGPDLSALARLDPPAPAVRSITPRRGLTPASDWISPAPAPLAQPAAHVAGAEPAPAPALVAAPPAVEPSDSPKVEAGFDPMAPRRDAPIFRLRQQTAAEPPLSDEAPAPAPAPASASTSANPDAPVAAQPRTVQTALATTPPPPVLGARFYSVHRQAGRQPDPIQAVQPIYLDGLPVEMTATPSSTDLARPDGPPALLRNSDGTVRAMPQTEGEDLP